MQTLFTRLISVGAFSLFASQHWPRLSMRLCTKTLIAVAALSICELFEDNGFNVKMIDHANMTPVKQRFRHRTSRQLPYRRNRRLCGGRPCAGSRDQ